MSGLRVERGLVMPMGPDGGFAGAGWPLGLWIAQGGRPREVRWGVAAQEGSPDGAGAGGDRGSGSG